MTQQTITKQIRTMYPLAEARTRLSVWEKARGILKGKKPNPIAELRKMRNEWERKLPKLK